MDNKKHPRIEIDKHYKSWWSGDKRVEPFMKNISEALLKNGITGDAKTEIYNRAYEAVHEAIKLYSDK
jgi:hypothetical protein